MKTKKGKNIFNFLRENINCLTKLNNSEFILPLNKCIEIAKIRHE